ncbi:MAG: 30S ribosomal protein S12 methylthiotransferase RimO [bacterium]|nr:30S ribosomal protein S12 methylthiotransferase RimO [bacterium]MDD3625391.1 30S ribosomal protein S12 methylthiotransferase RimO [Proteiniphilum sp.]MDD3968219.1 30S ribosomal protein S12 methylthiotransferase RimO [Proteiniphilum sp.]MDD4459747.1 30S ribosomal protein S12 methylthiotransferase RimO [Proteiniphilum sp.]
MVKNKIDVVTLGCSKNLVDSERLMRQLVANGYTVAHDPEIADGDIAIINTCGFIGDAKEESVNTILSFAEARKRNKLKKLYVMGCLSERYREELSQEIPEVDKFYGKFDWNGVIRDLGKSYYQELEYDRSLSTPPHYAYVKISEGCDRTCSYCSIPLITGKYKSRPMEEIEEEIRQLVNKGVKEFQFIAQDLTYYGLDRYRAMKLPELIERVADIPGAEWIRLHYAYPAHFPTDLLRVMRERENVCGYLDIALQHSSDRMLQLMRRNITHRQTVDLIQRFREEVPGIHLRTTMMVGHPGETGEDFQELLDFVRKTRFERLGAFPYSHEEDTYNDKHYKDDVPAEVKQERMERLMELQEGIALSVNEAKVGNTLKVIIDREDPEYYVGRTEYDSPEVDGEVLVGKRQALTIGDFYQVKIESALPFDLFGSVLE